MAGTGTPQDPWQLAAASCVNVARAQFLKGAIEAE